MTSEAHNEVIVLSVSDPDRSIHVYRDMVGFDLDVDYAPEPTFRVVQLTRRAPSASTQFGVGCRGRFLPGVDHGRAYYASFAKLYDPDGNRGLCKSAAVRALVRDPIVGAKESGKVEESS